MTRFFLLLFLVVGNILPTPGMAQIADDFTRLKLKGFPGCVLKVLYKYPGTIISVEGERTRKPGPKPELFYEFDIKLKENNKLNINISFFMLPPLFLLN